MDYFLPGFKKEFESVIDVIYLINVCITPFIAVNRKKMDKKLINTLYPKNELVRMEGCETRVRFLFLNYLNYFLLIDLLSSIVGIVTL